MTRGKQTCKILKEIRQQIADKNEIEYITSECHFRGECKGTCPKCEAEVKYLEDELHKRRLLGKAASIAGISLGIAGSFTACNTAPQQQPDTPAPEQKIETVDRDAILPDTVLIIDTIPTTQQILDSDRAFVGVVSGIEEDNFTNKVFDDDHIFNAVDTSPQFPGGVEKLMNFIIKNLVYPKEAEEKRIEGKVFVSFVIEEDGSVTNPTVIMGLAPMLDKEAIRVVNLMPKWKPGERNGKTVRVRFTLPIRFELD